MNIWRPLNRTFWLLGTLAVDTSSSMWQIGSVGLRKKEAIKKYGKDNVLIGMYRHENTAKGETMGVKDYFVKVIVEKETMKILGAHINIIGPYASVLIQEIINLMYTISHTPEQSVWLIGQQDARYIP